MSLSMRIVRVPFMCYSVTHTAGRLTSEWSRRGLTVTPRGSFAIVSQILKSPTHERTGSIPTLCSIDAEEASEDGVRPFSPDRRGWLSRHDAHEKARCGEERNPSMTARRFAINVVIFVAIITVMTAVAIWLNLGPVASSAT